ncbi:unnamed protein product [Durusdinium trenchii]|uniref:STAS domain-containing protein n=1 Tax=Durusdinium trenchii TaxID=1381693 RepID=A0ABP0KS54_9DINO
MTCNGAEPLLPPSRRAKPRCIFGYLPIWSECVPLNSDTGSVDSVRVTANVLAGCIIGIRQTLTGIVSATLVYTGSEYPEITDMFPFGISMMWYSTMAGSAFYAVFGRLQYNTNATQEVCAILYGAMAQNAAVTLRKVGRADQIQPTILALIVSSTMLTGICSVLLGKLGVGKLMLRFPTPVTSGFLGTIGFFLVRTALQVSSGVQFVNFYPVDFGAFFSMHSLAPVICLMVMVALIRNGPSAIAKAFPNSKLLKLSGLFCQLCPLGLFYIVVCLGGFSMGTLSKNGWTYPTQASRSFASLWTTYDLRDADVTVLLSNFPSMLMLVMMSVLCTMTGVLGITGKFRMGPDGDPAPMETVDFDAELTTVGFASIFAALSNGVVTFHRLGSSIQLRMDGGTHRLAVLTSSCFVGTFFFTSLPLGHYIPKFFLGGLFMGSGVSFLESAFLSYRSLPPQKFMGYRLPSPQYWVTVACILVATFSSPFHGIGAGLVLSLVIFLWDSAQSSPVASMSTGSHTVSRTFRPFWELEALCQHGHRILLFYLQGQLFFGSGQTLASSLVEAIEQDLLGGAVSERMSEYCILSFGKVTSIDASAAEQLRMAVKRVSEHGCKVIFCRMNSQVFDALSTLKVVTAPDVDLRQLLGLQTKGPSDVVGEDSNRLTDASEVGDASPPTLSRTLSCWGEGQPFKSSIYEDYDAFDDVTDALDYTGDRLLEKYLYQSSLKGYMLEYRNACSTGARLANEAFEAMNLLPEGFLTQIQPFCAIQMGLASGQRLAEDDAFCFVFQGAIAVVNELSDQKQTSQGVSIKGFQGRRQKRLRKRYPPGSIVGKHEFVLNSWQRLCDTGTTTSRVVSSLSSH